MAKEYKITSLRLQDLEKELNYLKTTPLGGAVILVTLSVVLTLISGLLPSRKAAKSDPVTALRSE